MKSGRKQARHLAFQTLFEIESRPALTLSEAVKTRVEEFEESGKQLEPQSVRFATQLVEGTLSKRAEIDGLIAQSAPAFPIDQMPLTDRVALELAMFEMFREDATPIKVVINEAVELAKTYGGENSGRFVNGVLGTIAEALNAGTGYSEAHGTDIPSDRAKHPIQNSSRR
jgi:transcription antitermination protein NusB